jgi:hypothetical protein
MVARRWIPVSACVQCVRVFNEQVMRCVQRAGRKIVRPHAVGVLRLGSVALSLRSKHALTGWSTVVPQLQPEWTSDVQAALGAVMKSI